MNKYLLILLITILSLAYCGGEENKGKTDVEGMQTLGTKAIEAKKPRDEYTAKAAGEWKEIANDHIPHIEIVRGAAHNNVHVEITGHDYNGAHYIEKIGIILEDKSEVSVVDVGPSIAPKVELTLSPMPKELEEVKVFAKCNLHDMWTASLKDAKKL